MKIVFTLNSLQCGGAERAVSFLAARLADEGHEVSVVTLDEGEQDFFDLPAAVRRVALGVAGVSGGAAAAVLANRRRVAALRRAFRLLAPDVIVSFLLEMNVRAEMAARPLGIPVVVSERIDPEAHPFPAVWRLLARRCYRRAACVVPNSSKVERWMHDWLPAGHVRCIPNMVEVPGSFQSGVPSIALPTGRILLAVGRLAEQKGYSRLLESFAACRERAGWNLVILGEGPERERLQERIGALGLTDRVHLPGRVRDPWPVLAAADLYVMSSLYEGFPNALLEAMAAGLPCVSFDCWGGVPELIHDREDGRLVAPGRGDELSRTLDELMADPAARARLGGAARESSRRFAPERVLASWREVLEQVVRLRQEAPCA